jgi:hypothetical protein
MFAVQRHGASWISMDLWIDTNRRALSANRLAFATPAAVWDRSRLQRAFGDDS